MREGEEILDIEETDEAWWTGTTANGQRGLFPCTLRNCCFHTPRLTSVRNSQLR